MQLHEQEDFLRYYWQELTYLRRMGALFARRYPKVAGRLELEADQSPDPHVERLLEAFAFLTARIQRTIDNDFPEIASELLDLVHPHYLRPVPSMTIARFDVDPERGKITTGHVVPKHTPLFTHSGAGQICRFRTCYPVTLWPLEVAYTGFESADQFDFLDSAAGVASILRIRVETQKDPLSELELDRLRFYLHGDSLLQASLYELLFARLLSVVVLPDAGGARRELPPGELRPVGFGSEDNVLPYPRYAQPAYRLIQEYFTFPEKYYFFELGGLEGLGAERHFDLIFLLDRAPGTRLSIDRETFVLGCTPVINLFSRSSEPIRVDHRHTEYRLVADIRRAETTEIHTVLKVSGIADFDVESKQYQPFYSFDHQMARNGHQTYWHARRVPCLRPDVVGTDVMLSFVDLGFNPRLPPTETVHARTLCTNRALAQQIQAGGLLQTEEVAPVARIVCLKKPTQTISPPLSGQNLWRLVSHLSLNYLSLSGGAESLKALREILRLYSFSEAAPVQQQISGIRELTHRKVVRRVGQEAWRGFCRGTEITLVFDEDAYVGTNAFLLGAVLNQFFALYSSTNHFTQLVIKSWQRDEEEWKRWKPMAGERVLL